MNRTRKHLLLLAEVIEIIENKAYEEDRGSFTNALEAILLDYGRKKKVLAMLSDNADTPQMPNFANSQDKNIVTQTVQVKSITINDGKNNG